MTRCASLFGFLIATLTAGVARAADSVAGKPVPGGTDFQLPVTPVMEDIIWLDDMLHVSMAVVVVFVLALMAYVIFRFDAKRNPTPARFTHNAVVEVVWTAVPVVILVIIAIPSLRLLFLQLDVPEPDLTIKATGNQWYWDYQYPDDGVEFSAFMIGQGAPGLTEDVRAELEEYGYTDEEYLLATDARVVVPVNANVHVLVTGADVIHAWAVPSFGVKIDSVPGRVNETWFRATQTGTYFGQCSELCGKDHSYMPIVVEVVEQEEYDAWVATMVAKQNGDTATDFAQVTQ